MLYSIFCCLGLPVSSASAELVLSKLKLVKSRLRTSMSDDRPTMSSLLVLASEKDLMTLLLLWLNRAHRLTHIYYRPIRFKLSCLQLQILEYPEILLLNKQPEGGHHYAAYSRGLQAFRGDCFQLPGGDSRPCTPQFANYFIDGIRGFR